MNREAQVVLALVATFAVACHGSDGFSAVDASSDDGGLNDEGGRPIDWAVAWVQGFYGTNYRGADVYSNTNDSGAPNGYYTSWRGDPGVTLFANVSDCSSFSNTLLLRSYGWQPATAQSRPHAEDYYWAIRGGDGFEEITKVNDIAVGDVLALLYQPGAADTGHVAWIAAAPAAFSGPPAKAGLSQWVISVIDSTNGFHDGANGPTTSADDRYLGRLADGGACSTDAQCIDLYGANALCNSTTLTAIRVCSLMGVGRGQMRLYADSTGVIQGSTWSPNDDSPYYPRPNPLPTQGGAFTGEDVVIGRYHR